MKFLFVVLFCFPTFIYAQNGIVFNNGLSWEQVLDKAKMQDKGIFIDFYTSYCVPCKIMAKEVFTKPRVAAFINKHFISISLQADSTARDSDTVRRWRGKTRELAARYQVKSYPTLMYLDHNGEPLHVVAGLWTSSDFLKLSKKALDPQARYYDLKKRYDAGERKPALLAALAMAAKEAFNKEAKSIASEYFALEKDVFSKTYLNLLTHFTDNSGDPGFSLLMRDPARVNAVIGKGEAQRIAFQIITHETVSVALTRQKSKEADWQQIAAEVSSKYPLNYEQITAYAKVEMYKLHEDTANFFSAVKAYVENYRQTVSVKNLADYSLAISMFYNEPGRLRYAVELSRQAVQKSNDPVFMFIYAQALHKSGKLKEALKWIDRSISMTEGSAQRIFMQAKEEMLNGGSDKTS